MKQALIIFVRNPVSGKVKTRLAKTIGDENALLVYKKLLEHTNNITKSLQVSKFVFYADTVNKNDCWENDIYDKKQQHGDDLGSIMYNAFEQLFKEGFKSVVIIGSDCFELTASIINEAFVQLRYYDLLAGPAFDGGYYLLGMKQLYADFFKAKEWSTDTVFKETISDADKLGLNYFLLPFLNDIDEEADLLKSNLVI